MTLHKVLILGHRFESLDVEKQILSGVADVFDGNALTTDQMENALKNAHVVMLGTRGQVDVPTLAKLANCRMIIRYGVGLDNVAVEEATRRGILVANVPDYCIEEVSNHTLALLFAANRRVLAADLAVRSGQWGFGVMKGVRRLSTQVMGIIGFGRIGRTVAERVRPFVKQVLAVDSIVAPSYMVEHGAEPMGLEALLRGSDYVSIHCPLTSATHHLFNAGTLAEMKPQAWLINTSRGGVIDESALIQALKDHRIGGAALDVMAREPPPKDSPFFGLDNAILTPHVASYSEDSMSDLQRLAAQQARSVLLGGPPLWPVNAIEHVSIEKKEPK